MKSILITSLALLGLTSIPLQAMAEHYDHARVISVTPAYAQTAVTSQVCRDIQVQEDRSYGGAIIGGIAGAAVGSTIGKGSGNVAAKIIGGATGAIVGDRIDNDRPSYRTTRDCQPVQEYRTVQQGYTVTYEYGGKSYSTPMDYHPGEWVKVLVSVTPVR